MNDEDDDKPPKVPPKGTYEVGYGKPPVESRFKRGQSGNPNGRPKGSRNRKRPSALEKHWRAVFFKEAYRKMTITDAKGMVTLPTAHGIFRSINLNALKGRVGAQRLFAKLFCAAHDETRREREAVLVKAFEYKLAWSDELERRRANGLTGAAPLIHPDNIVLDPETGELSFREPVTADEKAALAPWKERRDQLKKKLRELKVQLDDSKCRDREDVRKEIEAIRTVLSIIQDAFDGSRYAVKVLKEVKVPGKTNGS